jgi:hypothetical protein
VKIRTQESIRRYSFPEAPIWGAFKEHVNSQIIGYKGEEDIILRLEYTDDEGDIITISSEEEWKEMLNQKHNASLVTLFLKGWETVPKEVTKVTERREKLEDIEELSRREEEEALEQIRRSMEQEETRKQQECLEDARFYCIAEDVDKVKEDLKRSEEVERLNRLAEEELKRLEDERIKRLAEEEAKGRKEAIRLEKEERLQEKLKRRADKLSLKEEARRRAEELKKRRGN